ncbi:MAG TPA: radical SAM protein, partial [Candidatus Ozemobacteraceae bacterium]|nr:radical SAM protein [Candidatus Ozemobacteraceae bacterium]
MKTILINPPFVKDFCRTQRWAARTRGRVLRAPDWLANATAVLEQAQIPARLYDFPALSWDKQQLSQLVAREQPDVVVLDTTTPSIYSDLECARLIKSQNNAKVILVGTHVSALPDETLRLANGAVDVACIGEYDETVRDLILADFAPTVPGTVSWSEGKAVHGPARCLIDDLDRLPFPAWHHLDLFTYFDGGKLYPYLDIFSGRGCPNACSFCLWPHVMHGTRYRFRAPVRVVDEIEHDLRLCPEVQRTGEFFFEDDAFLVRRDRAAEICEEILRRNLRVTFSVNVRVDQADAEVFRLMKRAGCRELLVGFESGHQPLLNSMNKRTNLDQAFSFMSLAHHAGLEVHGCFVIGLPGETLESGEKTIDFALQLGLDTVQFSGAAPFPGTPFYDEVKKNGWLTAHDWHEWLRDGEQTALVSYPQLSASDIDTLVNRGLKRFYFRPSFMLRFLWNTRNFKDLKFLV